jgi:hypothetical protein
MCDSSTQVPFGGELCITPEYLLSASGSSAQDTFFNFMYREMNQGQATAYGDPGGTEEGDSRTSGWENHIYLDGVLLHTDTRRGPLDQGDGVEQPVRLNLGKPDGFAHTLSLLIDGKRSGDYTHDYGQVSFLPTSPLRCGCACELGERYTSVSPLVQG